MVSPSSSYPSVPWIRESRGPRTTLLWDARLAGQVARAALAAYPDEACGLLLGRRIPTGAVVLRVARARNSCAGKGTAGADHFDLEPGDFLRIHRAARAAELEVVGIWHSHPDRPAWPSELDRQAAWEDHAYAIASVSREALLELRSWRLRGGAFVEETVLEQPC